MNPSEFNLHQWAILYAAFHLICAVIMTHVIANDPITKRHGGPGIFWLAIWIAAPIIVLSWLFPQE